MVHVVTYDLESPNDKPEDYERVISGLKSIFPTWCHMEKSVWIVETSKDAGEVRDLLKQFLKSSDILFVAKLSGNWGSFNIGTNRSEWLKKREF